MSRTYHKLILEEEHDHRREGRQRRATSWSPNGNRKDKKKSRRDWKNNHRKNKVE